MGASHCCIVMLFLLSPAKALDYHTPVDAASASQPLFAAQSAELIALLRVRSAQQIADLMGLSASLAALNAARYAAWSPTAGAGNARPAALAFNGEVYRGLAARHLSAGELAWAQDHVCILSGLYGVLRPLDLMQPYRLEMGSPLANRRGKDLYSFWSTHIARYLNTRLKADISPVLVNLASQEYFRAVDTRALKARVVECVFEEARRDSFKVVGVHAKRARGLMVRYAIKRRLLTPRQLEGFCDEGYAFAPAASRPDRLVFRRAAP